MVEDLVEDQEDKDRNKTITYTSQRHTTPRQALTLPPPHITQNPPLTLLLRRTINHRIQLPATLTRAVGLRMSTTLDHLSASTTIMRSQRKHTPLIGHHLTRPINMPMNLLNL